jgi:hypothetical protein
VEKCVTTRERQLVIECQALDAGKPLLDQLLDGLDVKPYCIAPILSDFLMKQFDHRLTTYGNVVEAVKAVDCEIDALRYSTQCYTIYEVNYL